MAKINVKTVYDLPGGSKVEVHKPFGNKNYVALVSLDGRYPSKGKVAKDVNRQEYIFVTEGEITVHLNQIAHVLQNGDSILIENGDRYWIEGKGTSIVVVEDGENGASVEESE